MSIPDSPNAFSSPGSDSHFSEVATEPMPESERQLVHEYMTRRQHFLSDFEKYQPIQNMQMLAHHVFELSEGFVRLRNDFAGSRRLLDFLSQNQREVNGSVMALGQDVEKYGRDLGLVNDKVVWIQQDLSGLKGEVSGLKGEVTGLKQDVNGLKKDVSGLKGDVTGLKGDVSGLKGDVYGLKQDVSGLKQDVSGLKQDVSGLKQDFSGLKQDVSGIKQDVSGLKEDVFGFQTRVTTDIGGLKQDINSLRNEMHAIRQETQQSMLEIKQILTMGFIRA